MTKDSGDITEHPPETDIDLYVEDCNLRIERMGGDALWIAAYTHDSDAPDHHYDIKISDEGIHVSHRTEYPSEE